MPVSPPGTLAAAEVIVEDQVITLVSLYAGWKTPADGRKLSHADAAAHRLLSDLAAILTTPSGHRIVATGDLNIVNRYGDHGDPYWAARYATVFDRVEAMGLRFVGPAAPNGPQASPKSCPRAPATSRPITPGARRRWRDPPARLRVRLTAA